MAIVKRLPTRQGLEFIERWEAFRASPYRDAVGVPTIGYGTIRYEDGTPVTLADPPIDSGRAEALLLDHVGRLACPAVLRLIEVALSDPQYDALVSFVYNLGGGALQASTLRAKVNRGEHEAAAAEFPRWCNAGGRKLAGLLRRRQEEAALYLSGVTETAPAPAAPAPHPPPSAPARDTAPNFGTVTHH